MGYDSGAEYAQGCGSLRQTAVCVADAREAPGDDSDSVEAPVARRLCYAEDETENRNARMNLLEL